MFILIERRTLILKMVEREVFLMKSKFNISYPNEENVFMVPYHEKKGDYYVNHLYPNEKMNFYFKKWWEVKFFL